MGLAGTKGRLLLSCIAAPFVFLIFNFLFHFGLSYGSYSVHWLETPDVIRATNGPAEYFFRYVAELGSPLKSPKFLADEGILKNLRAKGRLRAHVAAVYLGKRQFAEYVEKAFPEYSSQAAKVRSSIHKKDDYSSNPSDYRNLTAAELSEMSLVIAKVYEGPITDDDIKRFRQINEDYFKRTGHSMTEAQIELALHMNKTVFDYNRELGQCLLISYDTKEPFVSKKLQSSRTNMEETGFARKSKLDSDFRRILSVAKREVLVDEFGDKYEPLTRDEILAGIARTELATENIEKLFKALSSLPKADVK